MELFNYINVVKPSVILIPRMYVSNKIMSVIILWFSSVENSTILNVTYGLNIRRYQAGNSLWINDIPYF